MAEITKQHPLYKEDLSYIINNVDIEQFKGKRFLITGATGLIGVCMIDALMYANQQGMGITIYAVGRNKQRAA